MTDAMLADLLGTAPTARRRIERGYTPAERWVVQLADGRSVFVKVAVNDLTAGWLRDEHRIYSALDASFMPRMLGWTGGDRPVLVLEDLSAALWPPPWTDERVASVLRMLGEVAATPAPPWLAAASSSGFLERGWRSVRDAPGPLLSTGVVSEAWLEKQLPVLLEASDACQLDGDALLHLDVRSDNLCFRADGSAVLVDWNLAVVGNPRLDIAAWLPTLVAEGGPPPEAILPRRRRRGSLHLRLLCRSRGTSADPRRARHPPAPARAAAPRAAMGLPRPGIAAPLAAGWRRPRSCASRDDASPRGRDSPICLANALTSHAMRRGGVETRLNRG